MMMKKKYVRGEKRTKAHDVVLSPFSQLFTDNKNFRVFKLRQLLVCGGIWATFVVGLFRENACHAHDPSRCQLDAVDCTRSRSLQKTFLNEKCYVYIVFILFDINICCLFEHLNYVT